MKHLQYELTEMRTIKWQWNIVYQLSQQMCIQFSDSFTRHFCTKDEMNRPIQNNTIVQLKTWVCFLCTQPIIIISNQFRWLKIIRFTFPALLFVPAMRRSVAISTNSQAVDPSNGTISGKIFRLSKPDSSNFHSNWFRNILPRYPTNCANRNVRWFVAIFIIVFTGNFEPITTSVSNSASWKPVLNYGIGHLCCQKNHEQPHATTDLSQCENVANWFRRSSEFGMSGSNRNSNIIELLLFSSFLVVSRNLQTLKDHSL